MKKVLCLVLTCMLVLSAFGTIAFASEDEIITTGAEFKTKVKSANFGKTFIIKGTETLADGSKGIILPDDYNSVALFHGTIKGEAGINNIQTTVPIFSSVSSSSATTDTVLENLVIKTNTPNGKGEIVLTGTENGWGVLVGNCNAARKLVIDGVTNYVSINSAAKLGLGTILGYAGAGATVEIKNCVNYGAVTGTSANTSFGAGGIVGSISKGSFTISNCENHGTITSVVKTAGILGNRATASGTDLITECANYGAIICNSIATSGTYGASGIATSYVNKIEKSFNAGSITSTCSAGGIFAGFATASNDEGAKGYNVIDCFNAGAVTSSATSTFYAGGVTGGYSNTNFVIQNCYNLGNVTGGEKTYDVGYAKNNGNKFWSGNYRINAIDDEESANAFTGKYITLNDLAKALPEGFSSDVWTYTEDAEYNYSLPQLKDNLFTNIVNDAWFFEVQEDVTEVTVSTHPLTFSSATDPSFVPTTEEGEEITGGYSVVAARFVLPTGVTANDVEFGMLVSKRVSGEELTAETCTKKAVAAKQYNGAFGILFYGDMVDGDTYYVRPYVKYNDAYTYGDASSFVFDAE